MAIIYTSRNLPASTAVVSGFWGPFFNTYAVRFTSDEGVYAGNTFSFSVNVNFPYDGTYTVVAGVDNEGSLTVAGVGCSVGGFNRNERTTTFYATAGSKTISGTVRNVDNGQPTFEGNPYGIAFTIDAPPPPPPPPPAPTVSLSASQSSIVTGNCTTLTYSSSGTGLSSASLTGFFNPGFSGSVTVCPTSTTTYTYQVCNSGGCTSRSVTINVIPPPSVSISTSLGSIIVGNCATISWSTSGTVDSISWNAESGITNGNFNSSEVVCPTDTTTYTVTATATILGTVYTAVATVTVIVYQIPSINYFSVPDSVLYNQNPVAVEYDFSYANISAELAVSLLYQGSSTYELDTTYFITPISGGALISSPNITRSGILDTYIPYNLLGPNKIQYVLTVNGSGGTITETLITDVIVDRTPDNIIIPETDEKIKGEDPVYSPDIAPNDVITSQLMSVNGIDVPVEIKSNYPIKVIVNQSNVLENVREL